MKSTAPKSARRLGSKGLRLDYGKTTLHRGGLERPSFTGVSVSKPSHFRVAHPGIARTLQFMTQNFHQPIQVRSLGEIAGLSRRGLFKAFLRHTGVRPAQVLRQLRIDRAKQLLRENELPLRDIAAHCGYRRVNSFWVSFRQVTGMSPGRFQQQLTTTN